MISVLFKWGMPRGIVERNPADNVPRIERPRDAKKVNRAWAHDEIAAVLEACKPELRVVVALGYYTGMSEGDVLRMPRSAYNGTTITFTRGKTGVPVVMHAHAKLREILDAAPAGALLAPNMWGKRYTLNGFRASFFAMIKRLELAGKVRPGLSFHGLRHTMGRDVIDSGSDTRDVMAMLGHKTEAMAQRYSQEADRARRSRAVVERLENNGRNLENILVK